MRSGLVVLTLIGVSLLAPLAWGMEAFLGEVVSVNPDKGILVVRPDPTEPPVTVQYDPKTAPGSLAPGSLIRIWGEAVSGADGKFAARHIRDASSCGNDPTGVRSRLHRGQGHGMGRGMGRGMSGGRGHGRGGH